MPVTVCINYAETTITEEYDNVCVYHNGECNEMFESGTMSLDAVPYVIFERGYINFDSGLPSLHVKYDVKAMYEHFMSEF